MKYCRLKQFCCGCSLQTGTKIVGVICLVVGTIGFILGIVDSISNAVAVNKVAGANNIIRIVGSALTITTSIFLLISAWNNHKSMFLLPWIILEAITFLIVIGYSLFFGIFLSIAGGYGIGIGYLIGSVVGAGLWLFFWLVVFSYYLELKEDAKLQQFSDRNMIDYDLVAFNDGVYRSHEGKMFSRV
ncbi:uncharacterized protein LOC124313387 isoform X2 [Daphnia pulicaria]|uniref:uncharacterized protein LOC124313387 isoform X2 n=1 Tax=Daphnia pulicaria TaxID=35523 RepID=UPI001EEA166F|nr:uncharacterized protein LOC124313387 isoform X2 [Daphnia pulicaria]